MNTHFLSSELRELEKLTVPAREAALKLKQFQWLDTSDSDSMCQALVAIGVRPSQFHDELEQLSRVVRLLRDGR